jgi:sulfate permease, SulP family
LVGDVPGGLPVWSLSGLALEDLYHILPGALALALVVYTESMAVAKTDANKYEYEIGPNQEMSACGLANIGAGLFQGFPVSGSLSRTAADEAAGGKSQLASLFCALLIFLTMLLLTGLFKYLPEATLAAIVIHALWHYFNPAELVRYFRVRKSDFVLSLAALLGVLLFGVMPGILAGVVLSLALLLERVSNPNVAVLGRKPGGTSFADTKVHPEYETIEGLVIFRFGAALVFPNAERFSSEALALISEATPPTRALVLDFEMISDMDTTASDQFDVLLSKLEKKGVSLRMARVHQAVRDFMEKDGLVEKVGEDNIYPRVMDAVAALENTDKSAHLTQSHDPE